MHIYTESFVLKFIGKMKGGKERDNQDKYMSY